MTVCVCVQVRDSLVSERERLFARLQELPFLQPFPSHANFVLARVRGRLGTGLAAEGGRRWPAAACMCTCVNAAVCGRYACAGHGRARRQGHQGHTRVQARHHGARVTAGVWVPAGAAQPPGRTAAAAAATAAAPGSGTHRQGRRGWRATAVRNPRVTGPRSAAHTRPAQSPTCVAHSRRLRRRPRPRRCAGAPLRQEGAVGLHPRQRGPARAHGRAHCGAEADVIRGAVMEAVRVTRLRACSAWTAWRRGCEAL
jgi:hypothetical protein